MGVRGGQGAGMELTFGLERRRETTPEHTKNLKRGFVFFLVLPLIEKPRVSHVTHASHVKTQCILRCSLSLSLLSLSLSLFVCTSAPQHQSASGGGGACTCALVCAVMRRRRRQGRMRKRGARACDGVCSCCGFCISLHPVKMTLVLDTKQTKQAIQALISHCEKMKESGATKNLFEDEGDVFNLQIALKKIPEKVSEKPVRAPLARARAMRRTAPASPLHSACHLSRTCNTTHPGSHRAPVFPLPLQR